MAGRQPPAPRRRFHDCISNVFSHWRPLALKYLLSAIATYLDSPYCSGREWRRDSAGQPTHHFNDELLPLPALVDGDTRTETWIAAFHRFGDASPTLVAAPDYYPWAQALVLGAIAQTLATRELLFCNDPRMGSILQSRPPRRTRLGPFLLVLPALLQRYGG
jgi:hypothetical protein